MDPAEDEQYRDPMIEALRREVDMPALLRNLKLTPQERIDQLIERQQTAERATCLDK